MSLPRVNDPAALTVPAARKDKSILLKIFVAALAVRWA